MGLCVGHKGLQAPEESRAAGNDFTEGFRLTTGVGQLHHAGRRRAIRLEQPGPSIHGHGGHWGNDRGGSPTVACLLGSAHA